MGKFTHHFAGSVDINISGMDVGDVIRKQLEKVGQGMVKVQLAKAFIDLGVGTDPMAIAEAILRGGDE